MQRTRVKICGITNLEDAQLAIEAGADALGFVFVEASPRCISVAHAAEIAACIPPFVNIVALFVSPSEAFVKQVISEVGVDTLQFHGDETNVFCAQFRIPFFKALRMHPNIDISEEVKQFPSARAILLDSYQVGKMGGTGQRFDWARLPSSFSLSKPIVLAGGLSGNNAQEAVLATHVYALDVSSGVESRPGKKDPDKMRNFIKEVQLADQISCSK